MISISTGAYINPACARCHLQMKYLRRLTAVAIGSSKHEALILTQGFSSRIINVAQPIVKGSGTIIGVDVNNKIRFIDIINFRPEETLEDLVGQMLKAETPFPFTSEFFKNSTQTLSYILSGKVLSPSYNTRISRIH
jgi:hypothetical protein